MKLLIDNSKVFLNWKYDSENVNRILRKKKIPIDQYRKMNTDEKLEMLGLFSMPPANVTSCIARDAEGKVIGYTTYSTPKGETFDKEISRRKTLQLLVTTLFPNVEGDWDATKQRRVIRTNIWNSYWNRGVVETKTEEIQAQTQTEEQSTSVAA